MACCCLVLHEDPREDNHGCLEGNGVRNDDSAGNAQVLVGSLEVVPIHNLNHFEDLFGIHCTIVADSVVVEDIDAALSCAENEDRHTVDPKDAEVVSTSAKDDRNHCILHAGHNIQEGDREADSRHDPAYCSRDLRLQALGYRMLQHCSLLLPEKHEWEGAVCSIDHQDENVAAAAS